MPVMVLDSLPRLSMSLGHHMSHHWAMTANANPNWSSSLHDSTDTETPASLNTFKKHHVGASHGETAALQKVILSQEAAATAKQALRRESAPPAFKPTSIPAIEEENDNITKDTDGNDPAWGIFKSQEAFLDMHIC